MKKSKKNILFSAIFVCFLILIDQITKKLAVLFLKNKAPIPIIHDIFELRYLENQSAAFGMDPISLLHNIFSFSIFDENPQLFLNVKMGFFIILTIAVVILLCIVYIRIPSKKKFRYMDWILIAFVAGAIGNFIDRVTNQYVIDFFYFKFIDFPIFNVADIYVAVAAFFMIVFGIFYYKEEDFEMIFPTNNK